MAKKVRFPLEMANGEKVNDIEALRKNFDLNSIVYYFMNGKLLKWLRFRHYDDEAKSITELTENESDLSLQLCRIFDIPYDETKIKRVNIDKLKNLEKYTTNIKLIGNIDRVAFSQQEFNSLLEDSVPEIYPVNNTFVIPPDLKNVAITGIGKVILRVFSEHSIDFEKQNVRFNNIELDYYYEVTVSSETGKKDNSDSTRLPDITISSILHVKAGERKQFKNQNIHLDSFINCEGTIEFNHCNVYYNEKDERTQITLTNGSELLVVDSSVICKGADKNHLVHSEGHSKIILENSKFIDCSFFIDGISDHFTMKKCELRNCYRSFINIGLYCSNPEYEISDNEIIANQLSEFNQKFESHNSGLISIFSIGNSKINFNNNRIVETPDFNKNKFDFYFLQQLLSSYYVSNCSFEGMTTGIEACEVKNCTFTNCQKCISNMVALENFSIENCLFKDSTNIFVGSNATIRHCQFVSCYDTLIDSSIAGDGAIKIEFCEFYNVRYTRYVNSRFDSACIIFKRDPDVVTNFNFIRKCKFDGVEIKCDNDNTFLISPRDMFTNDKKTSDIVACIEDCDFKNCYTDNPNKVLIKEWKEYTSLFRNKKVQAIKVRNCSGLDKVNTEGKVAKNFEIKSN